MKRTGTLQTFSLVTELTTTMLANEPACAACTLAADEPPVPDSEGSTGTRVGWSGVIGVEGELTGDGRLIEANALRWENLPIPLRYVPEDTGMHDGAVVVGTIETIERDGGDITATGTFDLTSPVGYEAARQVAEKLTNGVSMDLDDVDFEERIAGDLMEGDDGFFPLFLKGQTHTHASDDEAEPVEPDEPEEMPTDEDGRVTVMEIHSDDMVRVTTSGRVRAATIVAIPAFATAQIALDGELPAAPTAVTEDLVASAAPVHPPGEWFTAYLDEPTALTVTESGRVFGHLALWNTCHMTHTHTSCIRPPKNGTNYGYFHTGSLTVLDGTGKPMELAVGRITLDTRHAGKTLTPATASAHYENTGSVVADVRAGEDQHGIWVSGALRPGVSDAQLRALKAAPLSGDWRRVGNDLLLVAALSVNVPGFPVPRPAGLVASGALTSLVAAGMLPPARVIRPGKPGALSNEDLKYLKRLADQMRQSDNDTAAGFARRVQASKLKMRRELASV